jgi:hypothetical protein
VEKFGEAIGKLLICMSCSLIAAACATYVTGIAGDCFSRPFLNQVTIVLIFPMYFLLFLAISIKVLKPFQRPPDQGSA